MVAPLGSLTQTSLVVRIGFRTTSPLQPSRSKA